MKFLTLAEILAHKFVGQYGDFVQAFNAIDEFVDNKANTVEERAAALRHMYVNGMGCEQEVKEDNLTDAQLLAARDFEKTDYEGNPDR